MISQRSIQSNKKSPLLQQENLSVGSRAGYGRSTCRVVQDTVIVCTKVGNFSSLRLTSLIEAYGGRGHVLDL